MPGDGGGVMLLWPTVAVLGFFFLAGVIVVLGATSTARYEFERNAVHAQRRQAKVAVEVPAAGGPGAGPDGDHAHQGTGATMQQTQPTAVGIAAHPAGKRLGAEPAADPAWWLVDESGEGPGGQVVAGPFADAIDAEWAALSGGLDASVRAVHGAQRAGGGLVRRQPEQERAWLGELGEQLDRLPEDWDHLLTDDDALTTLVVEIAAALVEAGLTLHSCAGDDPAGGVCLTPGPHYAGVVVSWHQHDRMSTQQVRGPALESVVQRTMNAAVADLLDRLGFEVEPFGAGGSCLVTDLRGAGHEPL